MIDYELKTKQSRYESRMRYEFLGVLLNAFFIALLRFLNVM